jgi:squalene-associated FAD-dependent desaturase
MNTVHIIGGGLAGLSAAVHAQARGWTVRLYEAAGQAGGRCRSFEDATLGRVIDNGSHLILGANSAIFDYLGLTGARDRLVPMEDPRFPFLDVETGERWALRLPWGIGPRDGLTAIRLMIASPGARLGDYVDAKRPSWCRFWEPLAVATLNTEAAEGSARLIGRVLALALLKGREASRPYFARTSLGDVLVAPALARLDGAVTFGARLKSFTFEGERVRRLIFGDGEIALAPDDAVVLAVPSWDAGEMVPGLTVPGETRPIVNAHFVVGEGATLAGGAPFLGVVGGIAQWLFLRDGIVSATVSAAGPLADEPAEVVAEKIWRDIRYAIGAPEPLPPYRVIKEKRATIAQTPQSDSLRPGPATRWRNLALAGDWTATGLPATIESAVRSGEKAVTALQASLKS